MEQDANNIFIFLFPLNLKSLFVASLVLTKYLFRPGLEACDDPAHEMLLQEVSIGWMLGKVDHWLFQKLWQYDYFTIQHILVFVNTRIC